jgi:small GTP-binding protein
MTEDKNNEIASSIKVTLLGDSGVGKTCIIKRYTEKRFDSDVVSTPGASYSQKFLEINNKNIQLDIWDTAGQEQYRALGIHFYKDAFIVCLVYDITCRQTFDNLDNWYSDLKKYGEKYTITAVVGNKSDCYENEEVKEEEAREFAKKINSPFFLCSAKNGEGVDLIFKSLVEEYLGPEFTEKVRLTIAEKGKTEKIVMETKESKKEKKKFHC